MPLSHGQIRLRLWPLIGVQQHGCITRRSTKIYRICGYFIPQSTFREYRAEPVCLVLCKVQAANRFFRAAHAITVARLWRRGDPPLDMRCQVRSIGGKGSRLRRKGRVVTRRIRMPAIHATSNGAGRTEAPPGRRYTRLAAALHWLVAMLILGSYTSMYARQWLTQKATPAHVVALEIHIALGITIGAFVALRLAWRLANRPPDLPTGPAWQLAAARATHCLLYVLTILMPLSGYGATTRPPVYLSFVPGFRNTALYERLVTDLLGISWSTWVKSLFFIHHVSGAYFLWPLILLHIAAAFYHQFGRRDNAMHRMWF